MSHQMPLTHMHWRPSKCISIALQRAAVLFLDCILASAALYSVYSKTKVSKTQQFPLSINLNDLFCLALH